MDIFLTKKHIDSIQEAFIHLPEPCGGHFIMDVHTLFGYYGLLNKNAHLLLF